eukprot:1186925-Prorocentrum_minimum.AAC.2
MLTWWGPGGMRWFGRQSAGRASPHRFVTQSPALVRPYIEGAADGRDSSGRGTPPAADDAAAPFVFVADGNASSVTAALAPDSTPPSQHPPGNANAASAAAAASAPSVNVVGLGPVAAPSVNVAALAPEASASRRGEIASAEGELLADGCEITPSGVVLPLGPADVEAALRGTPAAEAARLVEVSDTL